MHFLSQSDQVAIVKGVAAFRTEFGCLGGVSRLPAALVALVLGDACGLLAAAFCAELAGILCAAGAGPAAVIGGLGAAAFRAELAGGGGS